MSRRHCFVLILPDLGLLQYFWPISLGEGVWGRCPVCALWTRTFSKGNFSVSSCIAVPFCLHTNKISILSNAWVLPQLYCLPTSWPCLSSSSHQACTKVAPTFLCPLSHLPFSLQPHPSTDDKLSRWWAPHHDWASPELSAPIFISQQHLASVLNCYFSENLSSPASITPLTYCPPNSSTFLLSYLCYFVTLLKQWNPIPSLSSLPTWSYSVLWL